MRVIAKTYLGERDFESVFREHFGTNVPETLNGDHRLLIVGSRIDDSSERIIRYLSGTHGVNINAATFQYFREVDGSEFVARVFLLEPEQVLLHSSSKGSSKRKPNLTWAELEAQAEDAGVADLYRHALAGFERHLQKHTTRSSVSFTGLIDGSRCSVFNLIPGQSDAAHGLCYQLYRDRFARLAGISRDNLGGLLPAVHEDWIYYQTAGPDFEGFEGIITSCAEIDRLAEALSSPGGK
ncbi:MAG: hypothetical protein O2895_03830 [Chloroflexi bacterium]|nr:hypothetical protein [Chloroflexota bacterium]